MNSALSTFQRTRDTETLLEERREGAAAARAGTSETNRLPFDDNLFLSS